MEFNLHIFAQDGKPIIPKPSTHLINPSALWQTHWVGQEQGIRCRGEARREACPCGSLEVLWCPLAFFTVRSLSALNLDVRFSSPGVNSHHWEWEWGKQPQSSMATTCNGKPQEHELWGNPGRGCPGLHDRTYSGPELMTTTLPLWLPCLGVTSKTTWF